MDKENEPTAVVAETETETETDTTTATATKDEPQPQNFIRTRKTPEQLAQQQEIDSRSIYIGNVDFQTTPDEIESHFNTAGPINRVTILYDRYTGYPKGYAYVEFEDTEAVKKAVDFLNGKEFNGRVISVSAKRTNLPGFNRSSRGSFRGGRDRGRGSFRGRGRGGSQRGRGGYTGNARGDEKAQGAGVVANNEAQKEY